MIKKAVSIQFSVKLGDIDYNQKKVASLVEKAYKDYRPDFILLPETWNLGFFPNNVYELAEEYQTSSSFHLLEDLAKKYNVNIIAGSIIIKENGKIRNRSLTFDRKGSLVHTHDKGHLFSPSKENQAFTKGTSNVVFELDNIKIGHIICYDLRFPEYARRLALEGATILFVSAEWPHPRLNHWQVLNKARAIENQYYLISSNGCGGANELKFCGHSAIIDPWGETIVEAKEDEILLYAELDVEKVKEVRRKIPVFSDRNLELY